MRFIKLGLLIGIPLLSFGIPIIYIGGLDFAVPTTATTPEQRVRNFIRKADMNRKRTKAIESVLFEAIELLPFTLDHNFDWIPRMREHFVFKFNGYDTGGSWSRFNPPYGCGSAYHDRSQEKITHVERINENQAFVETTVKAPDNYFVYRVIKKNNNWQLADVLPITTPRGVSLISESRRNLLMKPVKIAEPEEIYYNFERWFEDGRKIESWKSSHEVIRTVDAGKLTTKSGLLAVEWCYPEGAEFLPFARRVAPGSYRVERSYERQECFAVRLIIDESRPAIKYIPARLIDLNDESRLPLNAIYHKGDARHTALFDPASIYQATSREWEIFVCKFSQDIYRLDNRRNQLDVSSDFVEVPQAKIDYSLEGDDVAALFGNHSYDPVIGFWGINNQEKIASLVMVNSEFTIPEYESIMVDWNTSMLGKRIEHPVLNDLGIDLAIHELGIFCYVETDGSAPFFTRIQLVGVLDNDGNHIRIGNPIRKSYSFFGKEKNDQQTFKIIITLSTGYRFAF